MKHTDVSKTLMTLLLALATTPVVANSVANDFGSVFAPALPFVAQMSADERRAMRDRWEQAGPEERAQLRRTFQQRMRQMPPEQFDPRRVMESGERWIENPMQPMNTFRDGGFGTGYERRNDDSDGRGRR